MPLTFKVELVQGSTNVYLAFSESSHNCNLQGKPALLKSSIDVEMIVTFGFSKIMVVMSALQILFQVYMLFLLIGMPG